MSESQHQGNGMRRRDFLKWLGVGTVTAGIPFQLLVAETPDENPLERFVARGWEEIYRDQYA